jgi:hypothetical protein
MGAVNTTEHRRLWEERNLLVAGVLAFLVPGAGHFYQGRWFKGCIYFFCILGAYFGGMQLGEGAVVYQKPIGRNIRNVTLTFLAQSGIGLPSLVALYQGQRAESPSNRLQYDLAEPLSAPFHGELITSGQGHDDQKGVLDGQISLETRRDATLPETHGIFSGTLDGKPVELELTGPFSLERPISAGYQRKLECHVARLPALHPHQSQIIRGTIPRRFIDAFNAPADAATVQGLHGRLGKFYDLAIALTMIAGLLNVLAIWDAVDGPAYGFGDEPPPAEASQHAAAVPSAAKAPDDRPPTNTSAPSIR